MNAVALALKDWLIRHNLPIDNVEITLMMPSHMSAILASAAFAAENNDAPYGIRVRFSFRSEQ